MGDSVASVNITLFSSHDLRLAVSDRRRSERGRHIAVLAELEWYNVNDGVAGLLYYFKRDLPRERKSRKLGAVGEAAGKIAGAGAQGEMKRWVGAGVGDSVASVNITFFSSHDLRYRCRVRSALP